MFCTGIAVNLIAITGSITLGLARPDQISVLTFNPIKLVFFAGWIYLCMYSVQRVEYSELVSKKYKAIANAFSLLVGPFLLFVLLVADTSKRIQEGEISINEIWVKVFGNIFQRKKERSFQRGRHIELVSSSGKSFHEVYGDKSKDIRASREILTLAESIILDAIQQRASDILIDPKTDSAYSVRFRVDGFLRTLSQIESDKGTGVVSSIKAISNMDIAEKRRPQDGAFMAKVAYGDVHFRVATAGVLGGEKLSLRVLNQSTGLLRLEDIGLSDRVLPIITNAINQSSGMILVCGPTGSGKTTSLYAMLGTMDFYTRNVVSVEDPVEYVLAQASQIEVNVKANITFANALRSILRQDPDVICVGEIRDAETAEMALQASQTGHLVLATLHSSSNLATLVRLMELGIRPLLLASALSVIISQRLVRKLCDNCKSPAELSEKQISDFRSKGIDVRNIMAANGCRKCGGTGYFGRIAIMDVLTLDDRIKAILANDKLSPGDLKNQGDEKGRSTLKKEGMKKVLEGITTLDEVKRVTSNLG